MKLGEREDFHERNSNGSFKISYRPKFKLILLSTFSLLAGSPLSHAREWRREKRSGGKESGEEVPRKSLSRLAASPLDFALAASPHTLCTPT